jgi:hypothetical protein
MMTAVRDAAAASPSSPAPVHPAVDEALRAQAVAKEGKSSSSWSAFIFRWYVRLTVLLYGGMALALLEFERIELDALCVSAKVAASSRGGGRACDHQCSSKMLEDILHSAEEFELAASKFGTPEDDQAHSADAQAQLRMGQLLLALRPHWRENQRRRLDQRHQLVTSLRGLPVLGSLLAPLLRPHTLCTFEAIAWLRWQQWQTRWMNLNGRAMKTVDQKGQPQRKLVKEREAQQRASSTTPPATKDTKTKTTTTPPPPPSKE